MKAKMSQVNLNKQSSAGVDTKKNSAHKRTFESDTFAIKSLSFSFYRALSKRVEQTFFWFWLWTTLVFYVLTSFSYALHSLCASKKSNPSVLASSATFPHPREGLSCPLAILRRLKGYVYAQLNLRKWFGYFILCFLFSPFTALLHRSPLDKTCVHSQAPEGEGKSFHQALSSLVEVPNTHPTALSGPTGIPYRWQSVCHFQQVSAKKPMLVCQWFKKFTKTEKFC